MTPPLPPGSYSDCDARNKRGAVPASVPNQKISHRDPCGPPLDGDSNYPFGVSVCVCVCVCYPFYFPSIAVFNLMESRPSLPPPPSHPPASHCHPQFHSSVDGSLGNDPFRLAIEIQSKESFRNPSRILQESLASLKHLENRSMAPDFRMNGNVTRRHPCCENDTR